MAPAGGDQLSAILGTWEDGLFPGIKTIDHIAEDVHDSHLHLPFDDIKIDPSSMPVGFVNSKGFGGNNASAFILSPEETQIKMESLVTKNKYNQYLKNVGETRKKSSQYNKSCLKGNYQVTYKFNENVLNGETDIEISRKGMKLKGFKKPIKF